MTSGRSQAQKADVFRALHRGPRLLVLPNAWDVPSARVFEEAGFPAVATSSAALAASLGYPDGEKIPKGELFSAVRRMAGALQVPLTVDFETGYGETLEALEASTRRLIAAGAVGLNLEDTSLVRARTLRPVQEQVDRLRSVRRVASAVGIPIVVTARTDAFSAGKGSEKRRLLETLRRARAYEQADPDCLYPMGLADRESIADFVKAVNKPVNVMVRKGLPTVRELERLGVRRLSLGPTAMYASLGLMRRIAAELMEHGTYDALTSEAISYDELIALAVPKKSERGAAYP